jgi:choline dehydrogenase-like flavoprotein
VHNFVTQTYDLYSSFESNRRLRGAGQPRTVPRRKRPSGTALGDSLLLTGSKLRLHPVLAVVLAARPTGTGPFMLTEFYRCEAHITSRKILLSTCQGEGPFASAEILTRYDVPPGSWTLFAGIVRPKSRGRIRLTGPNPMDAVQIETNMMFHPDDLKAAIACVQLCREIGNSAALRPLTNREVTPGNLKGAKLENFTRDSVVTYWHQTCTGSHYLWNQNVR